MIKKLIKRYFYDQAKGETEFLPSALAITKTPPHPAPRWFLYVIFTIITFAFLWAILGKTDIVAVAEGVIIPSDKSQKIQVFERSVIKEIFVRDGSFVKKGDILINLEEGSFKADLDRITKEIIFYETEILAKESLINAIDNNTTPSLVKNDKFTGITETNNQLLQDYKTFKSSIEENQTRQDNISQEIISHNNAIIKKKKLKKIKKQRYDNYHSLGRSDYLPQNRVLEIKEEMITLDNDITSLGDMIDEKHKQIKQLTAEKKFLIQQAKLKATTQIQEAIKNLAVLKEEAIKAKILLDTTKITAPITGTIQQMTINTIGGVLNPAEPVMIIVPQDKPLEAEVNFLNKDIGFLETNQKVHIKIESFPYTKYGMIDGQIRIISGDAIQDENLGLIYKGRIKLEKTHINLENKKLSLVPGMKLTAEAKIREKRLISYFLSPLITTTSEGFRER